MSRSVWSSRTCVPLLLAAMTLLGGTAASDAATAPGTLVPIGGDYSAASL